MEEEVLIVDRDNNPVGSAPRSIMRRDKLIHRASYIVVFNASAQIFVQKRTMTKDIYPGFLDIAAGGVVQKDETYEDSAKRELKEELGITAPLTYCFDHFYGDADNRVWGRVFRCRHDGPFILQKEEVESGQFMNIDVVLRDFTNQCTPDGIEILHRLQG